MEKERKQKVVTASLLLAAFGLFCLCLCSCSRAEDDQPSGDGMAVSFSLSGIEAITRAAGESALAEGTTVRVLAYRHGANATLPSSGYVDENTYVMQGGALVPCTVSTSDGSYSASSSEVLSLVSGDYDFYAVTPALPVTCGTDNPTVSVGHGTDFAVSVTTSAVGYTGASSAQNVTLTTLKRQCALLSLAVDLSSDVSQGITNTCIRELTLSNMTATPLALTKEAFATGATDYSLVLGEELFVTDATDSRRASGSSIVLPKQAATFGVSMKLQFNGATSITVATKTGTLPAIAFDSGKRYTLSAKLTETGSLGLWLTISKWTTNDQEYGLGGVPTGPVITQLLGEWTRVSWESGLGGVPTGPVITGVSGWWTNVNYNPHLGSSDVGSND